MPLRSSWANERCPIARSLEVLGDPWVVLILRQAFSGARRFEQFRDQTGAADSVVSRRLSMLVEAGLLRRSPYSDGRRTRHEYVLTDAGADTLPVLHALAQWGERRRPHPDPGVRMGVVHRDCGAETATAEICSNCGKRLTAGSTSWRKSWQSPLDLALTGASDGADPDHPRAPT